MSRIPAHRVAEHPGALPREQIKEVRLTIARVAEAPGLVAARLHEIVRERSGVDTETAISFCAYLDKARSSG